MRIAKYISNSGYCSRREAEKLILNKKVKINNILCNHPSIKVSEKDNIKINNKIIKPNKLLRLWKLNKPTKIICTNNDPQKRKTIFDLIPKNYPRLISIGRLDYMSEGLILMTNNGNFARKLELPSSKYERIYRVSIRGLVKDVDIKTINKGIKIDEIEYRNIKIIMEKYIKPYSWLIFKLKEGKNREIRKICDNFSWNISRLIRIQFGPYKLKNLKKGQIIEIKKIS